LVVIIQETWHLFVHNNMQQLCSRFWTTTLYQHYLWGGPFGHGADRNELLLKRAHVLKDVIKLVTIMANYAFDPHLWHRIFTSRLEGEEVFGLAKHNTVCYLWADDNSHRFNHVNFFYPYVIVPPIQPNIINHIHI
jgi:hypothetical protein